MIKLKLDEMLHKRNLTAYALHKQTDLHQSVIGKIKNNQSKALQLAVLNTLCAALECSPSDLIEYVPDAPETVKPPEVPDMPKESKTMLSVEAAAVFMKCSEKEIKKMIRDGLPTEKGKINEKDLLKND